MLPFSACTGISPERKKSEFFFRMMVMLTLFDSLSRYIMGKNRQEGNSVDSVDFVEREWGETGNRENIK